MTVLALVVLLAQSPPEHPGALSRAVHTAIVAHVVAQAADIATTEYGLHTGQFREGNGALQWVSRGPAGIVVVKTAYTVASTWALVALHKQHPKTTLGLALALTAATGYAAAHNAIVIREARR